MTFDPEGVCGVAAECGPVFQRTIMALGHLVMSCGNLVFIDLIEHLLTELGRNDNMSTTRTYIQCTAAISRQAGHRIGETAGRRSGRFSSLTLS